MAHTRHIGYESTDRFSGSCDRCVYPVVRELPDQVGDFTVTPCPGCGAKVKLERLYGSFSDQNCDPRCQNALGRVCDCSCGGANHQSGYLPPIQTGEVSSDVVEKYRERVRVRQEAAAKASHTRQANKEAKLRESVTTFLASCPTEVQAVLCSDGDYPGRPDPDGVITAVRNHYIAADIRAYLWRKGQASEKQIELVAKLLNQEREHRARKAAEDAINWVPAPEGRVDIEGVVLSTKEVESQWGWNLKGLVRVDTADGAFKIWTSIPAAVHYHPIKDSSEPQRLISKGDRIRFTARLERSDDDKAFAFAKRPTKASFVDEKGAT